MHGRFSLVVSVVVVLSACGLPPDTMDRTNTLDSALGVADDAAGPGIQCAELFVSSDACLDAATFKQKMVGACAAQGLELTNYQNAVSCAVDHYKAADATCCKKTATPPPPPPPAPTCWEGSVTKGGLCVGETKLKAEAHAQCVGAGGRTLMKIDYDRTGCLGLDARKAAYLCCQ